MDRVRMSTELRATPIKGSLLALQTFPRSSTSNNKLKHTMAG